MARRVSDASSAGHEDAEEHATALETRLLLGEAVVQSESDAERLDGYLTAIQRLQPLPPSAAVDAAGRRAELEAVVYFLQEILGGDLNFAKRVHPPQVINDHGPALTVLRDILADNAVPMRDLHFAHDADGAQLGTEGARLMGQALRDNKTLLDVAMANGGIGDDGVLALVTGLTHNATLQRLSLRNSGIGATGFTALAEMLHSNKTLVEIDLHGNKLTSGRGRALDELLVANATLRRIDVSGCCMDDGGFRAARHTLLEEHARGTNTLRSLHGVPCADALLHLCTLAGITDVGPLASEPAPRRDGGTVATTAAARTDAALGVEVQAPLRVPAANIPIDSAEADTLEMLIGGLPADTEDDQLHVRELRSFLRADSVTVMSDNLRGSAAWSMLLAIIASDSASWQALSVPHSNLGDEGARELAAALVTNTKIDTLQLVNNNIGVDGQQHIVDAMICNDRCAIADVDIVPVDVLVSLLSEHKRLAGRRWAHYSVDERAHLVRSLQSMWKPTRRDGNDVFEFTYPSGQELVWGGVLGADGWAAATLHVECLVWTKRFVMAPMLALLALSDLATDVIVLSTRFFGDEAVVSTAGVDTTLLGILSAVAIVCALDAGSSMLAREGRFVDAVLHFLGLTVLLEAVRIIFGRAARVRVSLISGRHPLRGLESLVQLAQSRALVQAPAQIVLQGVLMLQPSPAAVNAAVPLTDDTILLVSVLLSIVTLIVTLIVRDVTSIEAQALSGEGEATNYGHSEKLRGVPDSDSDEEGMAMTPHGGNVATVDPRDLVTNNERRVVRVPLLCDTTQGACLLTPDFSVMGLYRATEVVARVGAWLLLAAAFGVGAAAAAAGVGVLTSVWWWLGSSYFFGDGVSAASRAPGNVARTHRQGRGVSCGCGMAPSSRGASACALHLFAPCLMGPYSFCYAPITRCHSAAQHKAGAYRSQVPATAVTWLYTLGASVVAFPGADFVTMPQQSQRLLGGWTWPDGAWLIARTIENGTAIALAIVIGGADDATAAAVVADPGRWDMLCMVIALAAGAQLLLFPMYLWRMGAAPRQPYWASALNLKMRTGLVATPSMHSNMARGHGSARVQPVTVAPRGSGDADGPTRVDVGVSNRD